MSLNYFVKPGEILKEYLEARNITQKELAEITSSSPRHISQVINGKVRISEDFAIKLEEVFEDVKAEFWLKLEMDYQLFKIRNKDKVFPNIKEIINDYKLDYVFKDYEYTDQDKIQEFLNIVEAPSIEVLEERIENNQEYLYKHADGDKKTIYLWLKLAEEQIDIQNDMEQVLDFNYDNFAERFTVIKKLLNTTDYVFALNNVRKYLNKYGIALVIEEAIPTSKISGATTIYKSKPVIYLSTRYKRLDSLYFTLMHEIYHIINKDYLNNKYAITYLDDDKEVLANYDTSGFFINEERYKKFVKEKDFDKEQITIFANKEGVIIDIIIGRLQRDGLIDYDEHHSLRTYIKEDDL